MLCYEVEKMKAICFIKKLHILLKEFKTVHVQLCQILNFGMAKRFSESFVNRADILQKVIKN